ncbi:hypothetical protein CALCODRAFT_500322 [Calocera cornea HHB12733]|uniref:Uncharacterized protein n=1 Tax=Calocera cornea HHB12733 TaxID=1353952 RepID=A0A165E4R3_9BASI|nr:hypothetical protein CALCODRAFT_500322 [Calocera cornea HHB12733]
MPIPDSPAPSKNPSLAYATDGSRNTTPNRPPLVADITNENRVAFRTDLPTTFDHFPPSGYPLIDRENGKPYGWTAGPTSVVDSLASCIRRGDAAPTPTKGMEKHVTFEHRGSKDVESEESGNESDDESKHGSKNSTGKGKGKSKAKDSSKALLSPRRAMKAAKKAKVDHGDD